MQRGIYSATYGEVAIAVSGGYVLHIDYIEKQQSCFISLNLKSWSDRKLLNPTTYFEAPLPTGCPQSGVCGAFIYATDSSFLTSHR